MRFLLLLGYLFFALSAHTQNIKGGAIQNDANSSRGTSRALVIGVSTYQNIPSLQFADRDATEFSDFLSHDDFWHISPENIVLLTNKNAKSGDILSSLTWLNESSKSGDRVVFYFSGHGDVETVHDDNQGYLLAYDSPQNNYVTGAIGINTLQKIFSELISKGVTLFIVTDACRAGHLAGGTAGIGQTAKAFSREWNSETKILSSGPDKPSKEGAQWGGGRGVFSFFLVKGLSGFADLNRDTLVTLSELEQYVGLQVAQETNFLQQPIFLGPEKFSNKVARTDSLILNRYAQWKSGSEIAVFVLNTNGSQNNKGRMALDSIGDCTAYTELLALLDDDHNDKLKWGKAIQLYDSILACAGSSVQQKSRYRLSASLMNDIQQTVNQTLIGQKLISRNELDDALQKISWIYEINKGYPLIYSDHLRCLRTYLLIDKTAFMDKYELDPYLKDQSIKASLDNAIASEPSAAYLLNAKGVLFLYTQKDREDSAILYFKRAMKFSPTWLWPKLLTAYAYEGLTKTDSAIYWLSEILRMDTAFQKFECAICFYIDLGILYFHKKEYALAETYYKKALAIDPTDVASMSNLLNVYSEWGKRGELLPLLKKIDRYDTSNSNKLMTLEMIIQNKILGKREIEERLRKIRDLLPEKDMGRYCYVEGLFKDYYNGGSSVKDYRNAVGWVQGVNAEEEEEYMLKLIESRISNNDLYYLGDYIDFVKSKMDSSLSASEKTGLEFDKALYLMISNPQKEKANKIIAEKFYAETGKEIVITEDKFNPEKRFEAALMILQGLMDKSLIDCNKLKEFREALKEYRVQPLHQRKFDLLFKPCHQ